MRVNKRRIDGSGVSCSGRGSNVFRGLFPRGDWKTPRKAGDGLEMGGGL